MRWQTLSIAAAFAGGVSASPFSNTTTTSNSTAPCGIITSQIVEFYNDPSKSSGIDNELAASFAKEYKKYVEFQTTLAYLKDPPSDYPYRPVDVLGGIDDIGNKAAAGGFSSQYAFDQALARLLTSAHEGHLFTSLCTASTIFYIRTVDLISLSIDGVKLPLIYTLDDADRHTDNLTVSNIVAINGQNVTAFIENEALYQISDPDASYNSMFWNVAQAPVDGFATGAFTQLGVNFYPGPFTNLTFANGTHKSFPNQAATSAKVWSTDIIDGDSFTYTFCIAPAMAGEQAAVSSAAPTSSPTDVPSPTSAIASQTSSTVPNPPTMLGHPETPIVKDSNNAVAGYFLNGTEYNDTAVLYVASFDNENFNDPTEYAFTFVNTTRDFFDAVKAANKTKLVIDLSGNGGGNTLLPNDLFQRLFPHIEPYGGGRYRIPPAGNIYGIALGSLTDAEVNPLATDNDTVAKFKSMVEDGSWNYRESLTTDLKNLTSWDEFFPPNVVKGDNFTINVRAPTNNTYFDTQIDFIVPYGSAGTPKDPQPFPVENIVILTDGICASACSIFTEFMTRQAGVKTIVVGGRPIDAPMQAIGGTKGSLAQPFSQFLLANDLVLSNGLVPDDLLDLANETFPGLGVVPLPLGDPTAIGKYSLNMRDNIPQGDDSQTPLQFVFEPANCRIYYNFMTASHPHKLWEYVADVAWKGKQCAWGGMDTNVTVGELGNSTGPVSNLSSGSPSGPEQVTRSEASGMTAAFSMMAAVVCVAVGMQLL